MSTRRVPLSSNPNVANSPLRGAAALNAQFGKQKRSYATIQREEPYGQPPPSKKQMLENGTARQLRSPTKIPRTTTRSAAQRASHQEAAAAQAKLSEKEADEVRQWQAHFLSKFPKMVFYFESIPDEQRVKLAKQCKSLGAREEKFFSNTITHVVTTRPIPPERGVARHNETTDAAKEQHQEQLKTINPSLLNRTNEASGLEKRGQLLFANTSSRRAAMEHADESIRRPRTTRNTDVLHRAREMGIKIWSHDKVLRMLDTLLRPDKYGNLAVPGNSRSAGAHGLTTSKAEPNLLQLLHNERLNGPSDRDPTVVTRELNYFKGPYIYIYDIEEKQKPIMVREYNRVADKRDGDWPQFRATTNGRCPFVEDYEITEKEMQRQERQTRTKEKVTKAALEAAPALQPPEAPAPKPVTGKRSLAQMEQVFNGQRAASNTRPAEFIKPSRELNVNVKPADLQPQNAFKSRAAAGRLFGGEPVASGLQASKATSAIRSQMISSTGGVTGGKAGTSKEIHGLQRKVLQKTSAPPSVDTSSRQHAEMSAESNFTRSASLGRTTAHRRLDMIEESREKKRTQSVPDTVAAKPKKRDPKPGYCENCQDKFADFDEHILSRKHRKFADNDDNWGELDSLLSQLKRLPRYTTDDDCDELL